MTITIKNYAEKLKSSTIKGVTKDWYKWKVFVDSDIETELNNIEYVEYELPPSIPNSYRKEKDRKSKFTTNFDSFGTFRSVPIRINVVFKNGTEMPMKYSLDENNPFPKEEAQVSHDLKESFVLKTTSFFKKEKQEKYWKDHRDLNGLKLYNIHACIDSNVEGALEGVDKVEYFLPAHPEKRKIQVKDKYKDKFLLKELAFGEFMLYAKVFLKGKEEPIELQQWIELKDEGPRIC